MTEERYVQAVGDPRRPLGVIENTEPGVQFCDSRLDRMVRAAERLQGPAAAQAWYAVDREAVDQAAWVPVSNPGGIDVVSARVGNYERNPQFGELLDQMWVR